MQIGGSEASSEQPIVNMIGPAAALHYEMTVKMDADVRLQPLVPKPVITRVWEERCY